MSMYMNWKAPASRASIILASAMMGVFAPVAAQAKQSSPTCDALVTIAGDLYLVNSAGKVLTRFTTGGVTADFATLSPDGDKVAYATDQTANTFKVVNKFGQKGSFPLSLSNNSYLMGLKWNANDVLRATKFWGKNYAQFAFLRIPEDLSPPAPTAAKSVMEDNCVLKGNGEKVACIDTGGIVSLGGGVNNGQGVFGVSGYEGVKPEESFTLSVGQSATTTETELAYKVSLKRIDKDGITLRITRPDGNWEQPTLTNGGSIGPPPPYEDEWGFFVTLLNKKPGWVRVDVIKSDAPVIKFDQGIAWQPHGQGLVFIQRTNTQTFLDLIQPGRGHVSGHPAKGQGAQWHLAAQVPVSWPGNVQSMRFLTPTLLLLNTGSSQEPSYSEVPIHIANGQDNGKPALTVGTVTPLPTTILTTTNGKTTQAPVLDWSCKAPHGNGN